VGFNGNSSNDDGSWGAVSNLDLFFASMYNFYQHKGLSNIVATGICNIATLAFTVIFSTFLFSFVDWGLLWSCKDESSCHHHLSAYLRSPIAHPRMADAFVLVWFLLFTLYWAWTVATVVATIREAASMSTLFHDRLGISARELQTMEWHEVVTRLEALQRSGRYTVALGGGAHHAHHVGDGDGGDGGEREDSSAPGFSARDIACRIMRKEVGGLWVSSLLLKHLHSPPPATHSTTELPHRNAEQGRAPVAASPPTLAPSAPRTG
jgi:hypothetical protein